MSAAESRSKTEKGKAAARLRILTLATAPPADPNKPKRYKDPAATNVRSGVEPRAEDVVDLGADFFAKKG